MKKLYVGHATKDFDFEGLLYSPLQHSDIALSHQLILPHAAGGGPFKSEALFKNADGDLLMLADLSVPSIGLGMEIAWARQYKIPVLFCAQTGSSPSSAAEFVWGTRYRLISYKNAEALTTGLALLL